MAVGMGVPGIVMWPALVLGIEIIPITSLESGDAGESVRGYSEGLACQTKT